MRRAGSTNFPGFRSVATQGPIQRRLQNEFNSKYGSEIFYRIKRGEASDLDHIIDNEEAARILLAFDLKQPFTCHQTYKLFDELHTDIFARPEVSANRIVVLYDVYETIKSCMPHIENALLANYRLTQYFLLHLLREALEKDDIGKEFCAQPGKFLRYTNAREIIRKCIEPVIKDLIIDLNAELREREADNDDTVIDYKRDLKSQKAVRELTHSIIPIYQKAIARDRASSFGKEWKNFISPMSPSA